MKPALRPVAAALCVALLTTACASQSERVGSSNYTQKPMREEFVQQTIATPEALNAYLSDKTVVLQFDSYPGGSQLRYYAADHSFYALLPFEDEVEAGKWEIREDAETGELKVCYVLANEFPGYTEVAWEWDPYECFTGTNVMDNIYQRVEGNPMGLEYEGPGYNMRNTFYSMDDYAHLIGTNPGALRYLPTAYFE